MAVLVGQGVDSEEIIVSVPSEAQGEADHSGFPGSRINFDVVIEEG